jgi:serine/threonine-protein kinase
VSRLPGVSSVREGASFVTVPEDGEEHRAFLQARVALFGKVLAATTSVFLLASASSYFLLAPAPSIATRIARDRYDLLAIGLFTTLWLVARHGRLPRVALEVLEAGVAIAACAGFAIMILPGYEELSMLVPALCALAILLLRAVFIPTTPRRTFLVSLAGALPQVAVVWVLARRLDAHTSIPSAIGPTVYVACWAGMMVALATVTSRVIHGLEQKVRAARQLGQYTLVERIGEGGMGVVYRAQHAMLRRPTAVKVLPPGKVGGESLARFEREVQLTSRLSHPNTVSIYDYGRTPDGLFYYAMELLDGVTVTELVEATGPLPPPRIAWLMRQICGSIAEAHRAGLIHRDIKPDNLMVCERGGQRDVVKVLDFGLVKDFGSLDPALSHESSLIGTPLYMAPESFTAPGAVGAATDLYALGAVAYYMAAGRHVFEARTLLELTAHHLTSEPAPLPAGTPGALAALILSCLAKQPSERPRAVEVLEERFAALLEATPWTQREARAWWAAHEPELARRRGERAPPARSPEPPRVLRSAAAEPLAPTVAARR